MMGICSNCNNAIRACPTGLNAISKFLEDSRELSRIANVNSRIAIHTRLLADAVYV